MRMTAVEIAAIKAATRETFGDGTVVRLFGSRVDDSLRGGDIDLHFVIDDGEQDYKNAGSLKWHLFSKIAERRVDLVFHVRGRELTPIDRVAIEEGVQL